MAPRPLCRRVVSDSPAEIRVGFPVAGHEHVDKAPRKQHAEHPSPLVKRKVALIGHSFYELAFRRGQVGLQLSDHVVHDLEFVCQTEQANSLNINSNGALP